MIQTHYDNLWEATISQVEEEIKRNIIPALPTPALTITHTLSNN